MMKQFVLTVLAAILFAGVPHRLDAQVYSPHITKTGQVDTWNLKDLAHGIYKQYNAHTDREKAEAIWRFYLTDGRFVKPGMWYHLLGYAYEEPNGQVLDPIKLLNSYGFGLCYQVAPLMAATYEAGGFKDARVWFLTGHDIAEVFYDGAYHYFDSDMMGYNPIGNGPLKQRDVASVYQLEHDPNIILKNVTGPKTSNPKSVDTPWYPADVQANAMRDMADLFTTTKDNYLFPYKRYPQGHSMDYILRPGEKMIQYFRPASPDIFYLPYTYNGTDWKVLPDFAAFHLNPLKGPRSEKDDRTWGTGKIEYRPGIDVGSVLTRHGHNATYMFSMPSPYVIIGAEFTMQVSLPDEHDKLDAETSIDGGRTWTKSASLAGPFDGPWTAHPAPMPGKYDRRNAVSGTYGYLVRFSLHGVSAQAPSIEDLLLTTLFQLNPRALPALAPGKNVFHYDSGKNVREQLPVRASHLKDFASSIQNASYRTQDGQGYWINKNGASGDVIFKIAAKPGERLSGFDVGGRFLDLRQGIAPDKFTAEIRHVAPWPVNPKAPETASIAWSTGSKGPWKTLWTYNPKLTWLDGQPIQQVLRWPEVDRGVRGLPAKTQQVYVRYQFQGLAVDKFRMASIRPEKSNASYHLKITQIWEEDGKQHEFHKDIKNASRAQQYDITIPKQAKVTNVALILECPAK